jgi:diguanylate cyclase (GGDEF)-like protein
MADLRKPGTIGRRTWIGLALLLLGLVGMLDAWTGSAFASGVFYLLPIALVTWFAGRGCGLALCVAASAVWLVADVTGDTAMATDWLVRAWNAGVLLGMFVVVCLLLPAVQALRRERELAREDPLTGAANRRRLRETVDLELMRSRRYDRPMTVAFIDLDGFKQVNDRFGHATGDRLLRAVADTLHGAVRRTDLLARVGGDEFVLLLPEIDQDAARVLVPKLQATLTTRMCERRWPVTFSIGVLTWRGGDVEAEDLITIADRLMYDIKHSGKDAIAYAVHAPAAQRSPPAAGALVHRLQPFPVEHHAGPR